MGQLAKVKDDQYVAPVKVSKFGLKDKVGYMFGDFGNDFFFALYIHVLDGFLYRCPSH